MSSTQHECRQLTMTELSIIKALLRAERKTLKREALMQAVWPGVNILPNTLSVHLSKIRRKVPPEVMKVLSLSEGVQLRMN